MNPDVPHPPESSGDSARFPNCQPTVSVDHLHAETARLRSEETSGSHGGRHRWMHVLMCAPMLLVVGYLVLTGRAGGGSIFYALGCIAMMGVMMAMMNHGSDDQGSRNHAPGHRR